MGDVVSALEIAEFLNSALIGKDLDIYTASSLSGLKKNSISFAKKNNLKIDKKTDALILVPLEYNHTEEHLSVIKVKNPRLAFAKVLNKYFAKKVSNGIDASSKIGKNCTIDKSVVIGANCIIGNNVQIKSNTVINHNVIISDNTIIGENCYIKSGTVVGEDGFGFDFEADGTPVRIPHLGSVVIGDNVEIGAKCTIARGTLDNTIIQDNVNIDDQVHIAHNCLIGQKTIITACAEISGSVTIGNGCWIGPNSSIIQKVKIGDNVTIGIGAIVTHSIESGKKVMGLDALDLRSLLKLKRRIEFGK